MSSRDWFECNQWKRKPPLTQHELWNEWSPTISKTFGPTIAQNSRGEFKQFCESKGVEIYNTHCETKSASASTEWLVWTQERLKKANSSSSLLDKCQYVTETKLQRGDLVRVAKDLPFKKGYKQNYTNEVFLVDKLATPNPPRYNLQASQGEKRLGKILETWNSFGSEKWTNLKFIFIHCLNGYFWGLHWFIQKPATPEHFPGRWLESGFIANYFPSQIIIFFLICTWKTNEKWR